MLVFCIVCCGWGLLTLGSKAGRILPPVAHKTSETRRRSSSRRRNSRSSKLSNSDHDQFDCPHASWVPDERAWLSTCPGSKLWSGALADLERWWTFRPARRPLLVLFLTLCSFSPLEVWCPLADSPIMIVELLTLCLLREWSDSLSGQQ